MFYWRLPTCQPCAKFFAFIISFHLHISALKARVSSQISRKKVRAQAGKRTCLRSQSRRQKQGQSPALAGAKPKRWTSHPVAWRWREAHCSQPCSLGKRTFHEGFCFCCTEECYFYAIVWLFSGWSPGCIPETCSWEPDSGCHLECDS